MLNKSLKKLLHYVFLAKNILRIYCIPRRVLEISGGRVRGRPRFGWTMRINVNGWCEGDLGQKRNDGGGCTTMRER